MKKLLLSGIALIALAVGPALAADLPRKAPPPVVPPPLPAIWNGWYVGLNAGAGWNNNNRNNNASAFCNTDIFGVGTCNNVLGALGPGAPRFVGSGNNAGFVGGGQIGWNYQAPASVWVWGVEADFQGADIHRAAAVDTRVDLSPILGGGLNLGETGVFSQRLNFLGTLRGRLGWAPGGPASPWLLYVTGGLAYGHVETEVAFTSRLTGIGGFCPLGGGNCLDRSTFVSKDDWRAGWTVGGGVEWMFAPRWSLKAEYLYYDLGRQTLNSEFGVFRASDGVRAFGFDADSRASNKGSIARAGINYHFGAY